MDTNVENCFLSIEEILNGSSKLIKLKNKKGFERKITNHSTCDKYYMIVNNRNWGKAMGIMKNSC